MDYVQHHLHLRERVAHVSHIGGTNTEYPNGSTVFSAFVYSLTFFVKH